MLAIQPWSTYALTQQMKRSLHYLWPRAESNLYAEAKRLVNAGLATTEMETTGKRSRTVYTITPSGCEALEKWLGTESAPSRFESETLLKVLFANEGSRAELLANLRAMQEEAAIAEAFCAAVADEYLRHEDPFPARVHLNALIFRWIWDQSAMKARWAEWAIAQVDRWPDTATPADLDAVREIFRAFPGPTDRVG